VLVEQRTLRVIEPLTGELFAERTLLAPGEPPSSMSTTAPPGPTSHVGQHGPEPERRRRPWLLAALQRAVVFNRWRAADIRSILAAHGQAPSPRPAGQALFLTLPRVPTRSLDDYRIDGGDPA